MSFQPDKLFNLQHQLGFYGAYHANKINIAVHIFFVPLIFWTAQVWLTQAFPAPSTGFLSHFTTGDFGQQLGLGIPLRFEAGGGFWVCAIYAAYYACLEPVALASYIPVMLAPMLVSSTGVAKLDGTFPWIFGLHLSSWAAQIASHAIAEGRAPALLDNLIGALVLAPFFTWLEILFLTINYRPDLKKKIENEAGKRIVQMNKEKRERVEARKMKGQ
ncbi:DUF962-domain-containing protein [Mrakia frigida]|uniref:2-hydroxy-palmitic acid dioxygenase MPO1 n=1 Tax=Mrakia frigida TaxID=29902 RepID=UPI003FCC2290